MSWKKLPFGNGGVRLVGFVFASVLLVFQVVAVESPAQSNRDARQSPRLRSEDDFIGKMRARLAQEVRETFDCCQRERDFFLQHTSPEQAAVAKAWRDLRRSEESMRLERLLKRIGESFDARIGPERGGFPEVGGGAPDCGHPHGGDKVLLEHLRRDHELMEKHHRMRMSEHVLRMLREEAREFDRWMRSRVDEDRHRTFSRATAPSRPRAATVPVSRSARPAGRTRSAGLAVTREPERKGLSADDVLAWIRGGGWLLFLGIVPLAVLAVVRLCRACVWLARLVRRQNDFYRRYEAGIVNRPLGPDVCWFCGERASGPVEGVLAECGVGVCDDCRHVQSVLQGWICGLGLLVAAVTFVVSTYRIYWTVWCDERTLIACLLGAVAALMAFGIVFFVLAIPLARVAHYRLGCRKNLDYELKAAKSEIGRRAEQRRRDEQAQHDEFERSYQAERRQWVERLLRGDDLSEEEFACAFDALEETVEKEPDNLAAKKLYDELNQAGAE